MPLIMTFFNWVSRDEGTRREPVLKLEGTSGASIRNAVDNTENEIWFGTFIF